MRAEIKQRVEMIRRGEVPEGYKQTKVGIIPREWEVKKFGNIVEKSVLGGNYSNSTKISRFPLIKMGNIARGRIDLSKLEYIAKGEIPESKHKLKKGDFLFNTRNTLELVGKVSVWRNELDTAYYNSNLLKITFKNDYIHNNFFMNYYFNSENTLSMLKAFAIGTTSVAAIYNRDLLNMNISLPPLKEQECISKILSTADKAIETTETLINLKQQKKKWLMQNLLTGKVRLPEYDNCQVPVQERIKMINDGMVPEGYKQTKVGIIPGDWKVVKLKEYISHKTEKYDPVKSNESYKCIELEHIEPVIGKLNGFNNSKEQKSIKNKFLKGQVLFGKLRPYLRKFYFTKFDGVCSSEIWVLSSLNKKNENKYIFYLVQTNRFINIANSTTGTKMPRADWNFMKESSFYIPFNIEQTAIANILSTADKEIDLLNQKLDTLKQQKKALMQLLLTGIVRTTGLKTN